MKPRLVYWLTYAGMQLLALLSFRALYVLSGGLCFLMHRTVHHRRRMVCNNLCNIFPEKSEVELREIECKFYRYICDYMLEEVKMLYMPFRELCYRMEYDNKEKFLVMIEGHGGIMPLTPHYANSEWTIDMGAITQEGDISVQIYGLLRNRHMDAISRRICARSGGYNVSEHSTAREIIKLHRDDKRVAAGMTTDQSPSINETHHWATFLNQNTGFMGGAGRIAKLTDFPVFYCESKKQRGGYRRVEFDSMTGIPKETAGEEITELFVRRLEQTIHKEPAY